MSRKTQERVDSLAWFQRYEVVPGVWTNGRSDMAALLRRIVLPESLKGLAVADIGTNDGFLAFECVRRGAGFVAAIDHPQWGFAGHAEGNGWERFELAYQLQERWIADRITALIFDVERDDILTLLDSVGPFDLVLFCGVLYHVRDMLGTLARMRKLLKPGGMMILETHSDLGDVAGAAIRPYPNGWGDDPTTYWGPNRAAVHSLVSMAGFKPIFSWGPEDTRIVCHARLVAR